MVAWEKEEHGEIDTRASLLPFRRSLLHKCVQVFVCTLSLFCNIRVFTSFHSTQCANAGVQMFWVFLYLVHMPGKAHNCTLRISFGVCHDILTSWWVTIDCWGREGPARCDNWQRSQAFAFFGKTAFPCSVPKWKNANTDATCAVGKYHKRKTMCI